MTALNPLLFATLLGAVGLGAGVYETALVDRVWPGNPRLIQPDRGGINRKHFWGPFHGLFEIALLVALWSTWANSTVRWWVLAALAVHLAARIWTFAYFIPAAMGFEKLGDFAPDQTRKARTWVRLSVWRLPLELAAVALLWVAVTNAG